MCSSSKRKRSGPGRGKPNPDRHRQSLKPPPLLLLLFLHSILSPRNKPVNRLARPPRPPRILPCPLPQLSRLPTSTSSHSPPPSPKILPISLGPSAHPSQLRRCFVCTVLLLPLAWRNPTETLPSPSLRLRLPLQSFINTRILQQPRATIPSSLSQHPRPRHPPTSRLRPWSLQRPHRIPLHELRALLRSFCCKPDSILFNIGDLASPPIKQ